MSGSKIQILEEAGVEVQVKDNCNLNQRCGGRGWI